MLELAIALAYLLTGVIFVRVAYVIDSNWNDGESIADELDGEEMFIMFGLIVGWPLVLLVFTLAGIGHGLYFLITRPTRRQRRKLLHEKVEKEEQEVRRLAEKNDLDY